MFKGSIVLLCSNLNLKLFDLLMGEPSNSHFLGNESLKIANTLKPLNSARLVRGTRDFKGFLEQNQENQMKTAGEMPIFL